MVWNFLQLYKKTPLDYEVWYNSIELDLVTIVTAMLTTSYYIPFCSTLYFIPFCEEKGQVILLLVVLPGSKIVLYGKRCSLKIPLFGLW